ncbi:MAG: hypothetical protein QXO71_09960 [Candidatus Jordarchaeaceae archaeon]
MRKTSEIIKECMKVLRGDTNPFNIPVYEYAVKLQEDLPKVNLSNIAEHSEALHSLVMVHGKRINEAYKLLSPDFLTSKNLKEKFQKLDVNSLSNLIKLRPVVKLNIVTTAGLLYSLAFLKGQEYIPLIFPQDKKVEVKTDVANFYDEPNFMNIVKNFINLLRKSNKIEMFKIIHSNTWEETVRRFMAFTFLIDSRKIRIKIERNKKFLEVA